ncbi:hypothetical protein CsSME_00031249 [Camellia sinensis var. sinensis]
MIMAMPPPAMTRAGMHVSKTNERSHPLAKAMANPPINVDISCMNFPTFSPIASWMRIVSPDILPMTSPVVVSVSKNAMSCLNIVFKYNRLMCSACLSPVTIQQVTCRNEAIPEAMAKYKNLRDTFETSWTTCEGSELLKELMSVPKIKVMTG